MDFCIQDNEIYYVDKSGEKAAEVTFPSIDADTVEINHTFVSPSLRGTGVAGKIDAGGSRGNFQTGKKGSAYLFLCYKLV